MSTGTVGNGERDECSEGRSRDGTMWDRGAGDGT